MKDMKNCTESHTPCPKQYVEWHEWAEEMSKTHVQTKCHSCELYVTWLPKLPTESVDKPVDNSTNSHDH